jgi:hypothetical protein
VNELLLWISAVAKGSESSFRRKAAELTPARKGRFAAHRIAEWNLGMLSHCEFGAAADGGWRVAPPVLAATDPAGRPAAVLCGARTDDLKQRLLNSAEGRVSITSPAAAPDIIKINAGSNSELRQIAEKARVPLQWNTPLAILSCFQRPSRMSLPETSLPTGAWTVSRFSRSRLRWVDGDIRQADKAPTGLFRFASEYGTRYVLKERHACLEVEAAAGKYRLLGPRQRALRFDLSRGVAMVPLSARPPSLIERALVSCSGHLPVIENGALIYIEITPSVAAAVTAALGR